MGCAMGGATVLTTANDEGSAGTSAFWHMSYHSKLAVVMLHDLFHDHITYSMIAR